MMRCLLIMLFTCFGYFAIGKGNDMDTAGLGQARAMLSSGLLNKDTAVLKKVLHRKVTYGHSNGWVETKRELMSNLLSGKLAYRSIKENTPVVIDEGDTYIVRTHTEVSFLLDGEAMNMNLHVLQIWKKDKKKWVLLARQSGKM